MLEEVRNVLDSNKGLNAYLENARGFLHDKNVIKNAKAYELRNKTILGPLAMQYEIVLRQLMEYTDSYVKAKKSAIKEFKKACKDLEKTLDSLVNYLQTTLDELENIRKEASNITNFDGLISEVYENMPYLRRLLGEPIFWNTYDGIKLVETNVSGAIGNIGDIGKQLTKAAVSALLENLDGYAIPTEFLTLITNITQIFYIKCLPLEFLPSHLRPQVTNAYYWHTEGDVDKDNKTAEAIPTFEGWQGVVIPVFDQQYINNAEERAKFKISDPSTYYLLSPESRAQMQRGYNYWKSNFRNSNNPIMNSSLQFGERHSPVDFCLKVSDPTNHLIKAVPKYPAFNQWGELIGFMEWPSEDFEPSKYEESQNTQGFKTYNISGFRTTMKAVVAPQYTYIFDAENKYVRKVANMIPKSTPSTTQWSLMDLVYEVYAMVGDIENLSIYGGYYKSRFNELLSNLGLEIKTEQGELVQEAGSNGKNAVVYISIIPEFTKPVRKLLDKLYSLRDEIQAAFDSW